MDKSKQHYFKNVTAILNGWLHPRLEATHRDKQSNQPCETSLLCDHQAIIFLKKTLKAEYL